MTYIFRDAVWLCSDCKETSGNGIPIYIVYFNTGGFSPDVEGRACLHLTSAQIKESMQ